MDSAPSSTARATVESTSSVPRYGSQCEGAPASLASSGSPISPPIGWPSTVNIV